MTKEEFFNLYNKKDTDTSITQFSNEIGFSLVRDYPKNTPYNKDGKKMFIKVALLKDKLFYSVDMTKPEQREGEQTSYIITEGQEYGKKTTNFFSDDQEPFIFNKNEKRIIFKPKNKKFTINEFIDILVLNHLSDRLFFKRISNFISGLILKIIFWLSDKHYDRVKTAIDQYHFKQKEYSTEEKINNVDPFFKYFLISRNTLFSGLIFAFLIAVLLSQCKFIGEFTVANPLIVLAFFLLLSFCEKISIWLNNKIKEFFTPRKFYNEKPNFIEKLHNYQYENKFKLKLK
ncbi:MAG: hypothetical protein ABL927_10405 [Bdellovibrionales bacterium]